MKPCFMRAFSVDLAAAVDHDDSLKPRPVMTVPEPPDIVDHGRGPGFDTAVVAVDGGVPCSLCIGEALGLLFGDGNLDILVQRPLVALQGQNVVGFLVEDRLGDVLWHTM